MSESERFRNIYTQFPGGKHKVLTLSYDDGKSVVVNIKK